MYKYFINNICAILMFPTVYALLYCEIVRCVFALRFCDMLLMGFCVCLCSEGGTGPQAGGGGVRSEHERRRSASQRRLRPHPPEQAGRLLSQGVSADRYRQTRETGKC